MGSFSCGGPSEDIVRQFEQLLGISSRNGYFHLNEEQIRACLDEIIQRQAASPAGPKPYSVVQAITVTQWRIDGVNVPTRSMFHMHYGRLPCLSTFLQFDSIEHFQYIKRVLEDLKICKLNEKHLKLARNRKARE